MSDAMFIEALKSEPDPSSRNRKLSKDLAEWIIHIKSSTDFYDREEARASLIDVLEQALDLTGFGPKT